MPIHCKVTPQNFIMLPWQFSSTNLHSWVEWLRLCESKVFCQRTQHNDLAKPQNLYTPSLPSLPSPKPRFQHINHFLSHPVSYLTQKKSMSIHIHLISPAIMHELQLGNCRFLYTRHLQEYISEFFSGPYFHYCLLSSVHYCGDLSHILFFMHCSHMIFIYSQSFIHHSTGLFGTNIMISFQLAC